MSLPIKLISTDFDGTIYAEFEDPPVSKQLERLIGDLQSRGAKWVINTGRDMTSLQRALERIKLSIKPDYLILVEREIHCRDGTTFASLAEWNDRCTLAHEQLFVRIRPDLPRLIAWIQTRFPAVIYEDPYSPFCLEVGNESDTEMIYAYLDEYCSGIPDLVLMRNSVYARFSHVGYNKGTALAEVGRRLGISPAQVFAAGDHSNDLPMLSRTYARWLAAPHNAIEMVKSAIRSEKGYLSQLSHGHGVADALSFCLEDASRTGF